AVYAQAVRDALADFLAWTQDPRHTPRVRGWEAREALRVALAVRYRARQDESDQESSDQRFAA
ncbi:MAG TPA: hypothetical protein VGM23_03145, partial [Armatimonadota bacterium]